MAPEEGRRAEMSAEYAPKGGTSVADLLGSEPLKAGDNHAAPHERLHQVQPEHFQRHLQSQGSANELPSQQLDTFAAAEGASFSGDGGGGWRRNGSRQQRRPPKSTEASGSGGNVTERRMPPAAGPAEGRTSARASGAWSSKGGAATEKS